MWEGGEGVCTQCLCECGVCVSVGVCTPCVCVGGSVHAVFVCVCWGLGGVHALCVCGGGRVVCVCTPCLCLWGGVHVVCCVGRCGGVCVGGVVFV